MAAEPSQYLPIDYPYKEKICSNPNEPENCVYLVDGKYYYIEIDVDMGGWHWLSLLYVAGVTQTG